MVAVVPSPVQVTIENPALAFALTLEVMEPCVLVTVDEPASQHQATWASGETLTGAHDPRLKPSEVKAVRAVVSVDSAFVA